MGRPTSATPRLRRPALDSQETTLDTLGRARGKYARHPHSHSVRTVTKCGRTWAAPGRLRRKNAHPRCSSLFPNEALPPSSQPQQIQGPVGELDIHTEQKKKSNYALREEVISRHHADSGLNIWSLALELVLNQWASADVTHMRGLLGVGSTRRLTPCIRANSDRDKSSRIVQSAP